MRNPIEVVPLKRRYLTRDQLSKSDRVFALIGDAQHSSSAHEHEARGYLNDFSRKCQIQSLHELGSELLHVGLPGAIWTIRTHEADVGLFSAAGSTLWRLHRGYLQGVEPVGELHHEGPFLGIGSPAPSLERGIHCHSDPDASREESGGRVAALTVSDTSKLVWRLKNAPHPRPFASLRVTEHYNASRPAILAEGISRV